MVKGCTTSTKTNSTITKEKKYRNVIIEFLIVSLVTLYLGSCSPFFIVGKLSCTAALVFLYYVLNFLIFNKFNPVTISLSAVLCIGLTVTSGGVAITTKTEYYTPKQIYKNNSQTVVIGENMVLVDTTIKMYNSKNPYLCKDIQINGFKDRIGDYWYVCEKNK
jgi:hypothetical protein